MKPAFRIEAWGVTDVGRVRQHNEDELGCFPELGLFVVADGMGGHSSGDRASKLAVAVAREHFEETAGRAEAPQPFAPGRTRSHEESRLVAAVELGNRRLLEAIERDRTWKGMGATVAAVSLAGGRAQIAHIGDTRVYRLRGGALEQLTRDHTLANDYEELYPDMSPEQAATIPPNIITRAIGMKDRAAVDSRSVPLDGGDVLLLSTDGVHGLVPDGQITAILLEHRDVRAAAEKLLAAALENGGTDNATCLVVRVTEA